MAQHLNLRIDQGSEYRHTFHYREPDGVTPISLAGFSARAHVRLSPWSDTTIYEATTDTSGLEITNAGQGTLVLTVPGTVSAAWINDQSIYDIEIVSTSDDKPYRIVQGKIFMNSEATR